MERRPWITSTNPIDSTIQHLNKGSVLEPCPKQTKIKSHAREHKNPIHIFPEQQTHCNKTHHFQKPIKHKRWKSPENNKPRFKFHSISKHPPNFSMIKSNSSPAKSKTSTRKLTLLPFQTWYTLFAIATNLRYAGRESKIWNLWVFIS